MGLADEIIATYGDYYVDGGQNQRNLTRNYYARTETEQVATGQRTDNTVYRMAEAEMTEVLQPYQSEFTSKGAANFHPRPIELQHMKVDYSVNPYEVRGNWLDFLAENEIDPTQFPLVRYLMENHLMQRLKHDIETKGVFLGEPKAPSAGTPGAAIDSMLGIKKQLIDGVAAGNINHVSDTNLGGALSEDTIVGQIEKFVDKIDSDVLPDIRTVNLSKKWRKNYLRDYRDSGYFINPNEVNNNLDFEENMRLEGLRSMAGSDIIFATPAWNFQSLRKNGQNEGRFEIQKDKRNVAIFTDFHRGIGFAVPELVWAYIPDSLLNASS
ncbi:MAG: hypothetical protein K9J21_11865 [Bacteroidales bacterium]|nr:hypothetical protein [Bacteroidales bacterium]